MSLKKYIVGISMILASATAFAKPNAITVDGSLLNYFPAAPTISGMMLVKDSTDLANITMTEANVVIPPTNGDRVGAYIALGSAGIQYSIVVSNLNNDVMVRLLDSNSGSACYWYFHPKNPVPELDSSQSTPGICALSGMYDFIMQTKTNKQ